VLALIEACERLGLTYHLGVSAAISSFYAGQSRPSYHDYPGMVPDRVEQLQRMGVMNIEMESATIFTLASLFGLRGGAACVVIADRFRNEFRTEGSEEKLARLGAETTAALAGMDEQKRVAGKQWYFPGLQTP
jgi:uridine phosphorylase